MNNQEVKIGGGMSHIIKGIGSSTVKIVFSKIKLKHVKYVPSMKRNLISVGSNVGTRN